MFVIPEGAMLLKHRNTGHIVAVDDLQDLINVFHPRVLARDQVGEEEQDAEPIMKCDLTFLSGEPLPRCWSDPHYRDEERLH
jgi:hypothetical protein